MTFLTAKPPSATKRGESVWERAKNFPAQGYWTEEDYLALDNERNQMIEFTDGYVEVLPTPTRRHQMIVKFLVRALTAFAEPDFGEVMFAPLPTKLRSKLWREPDVLLVLNENLPKGDYPVKVDLVVEVVSSDKRSHIRDYREKRLDYAKAGISEYWIVDPKKAQITVLRLVRNRYVEHGVFKKGASATSALLNGFSVEVSAVFKTDR